LSEIESAAASAEKPEVLAAESLDQDVWLAHELIEKAPRTEVPSVGRGCGCYKMSSAQSGYLRQIGNNRIASWKRNEFSAEVTSMPPTRTAWRNL
jgi:hypothetical protein